MVNKSSLPKATGLPEHMRMDRKKLDMLCLRPCRTTDENVRENSPTYGDSFPKVCQWLGAPPP
jgi:hypothetical protein